MRIDTKRAVSAILDGWMSDAHLNVAEVADIIRVSEVEIEGWRAITIPINRYRLLLVLQACEALSAPRGRVLNALDTHCYGDAMMLLKAQL